MSLLSNKRPQNKPLTRSQEISSYYMVAAKDRRAMLLPPRIVCVWNFVCVCCGVGGGHFLCTSVCEASISEILCLHRPLCQHCENIFTALSAPKHYLAPCFWKLLCLLDVCLPSQRRHSLPEKDRGEAAASHHVFFKFLLKRWTSGSLSCSHFLSLIAEVEPHACHSRTSIMLPEGGNDSIARRQARLLEHILGETPHSWVD